MQFAVDTTASRKDGQYTNAAQLKDFHAVSTYSRFPNSDPDDRCYLPQTKHSWNVRPSCISTMCQPYQKQMLAPLAKCCQEPCVSCSYSMCTKHLVKEAWVQTLSSHSISLTKCTITYYIVSVYIAESFRLFVSPFSKIMINRLPCWLLLTRCIAIIDRSFAFWSVLSQYQVDYSKDILPSKAVKFTRWSAKCNHSICTR